MISKQFEKFADADYRNAFVASQINIGIPFQLRALMKARGWTQEQLAARTGMLQPRISAMLKPGKVRPNIETLRRMAEAFDVGLVVRFAPFSELARWSEEFDPERFDVPSFESDLGFVEKKHPAAQWWQSASGIANADLEPSRNTLHNIFYHSGFSAGAFQAAELPVSPMASATGPVVDIASHRNYKQLEIPVQIPMRAYAGR
jgi:transcriptional regulator with XRE-family HTH domain